MGRNRILDRIDHLRRKGMHRLTRKIGNSHPPSKPVLDPSDTIHVLISRPNHRLGNLLLITPLLQEVSRTFPKAKIDLFVKGKLPSVLFENYPNVHTLIELPRKPFDELTGYLKAWLFIRKKDYDLVINIDRDSSSGTLSTSFANSKYKIFGTHEQELPADLKEQKHIAKNPVLALRNFVAQAGISTNAPIPPLNLKLTRDELSAGKQILQGFLPEPEIKTICLFTFATGHKCYSEDWWCRFYEMLKDNFHTYHFIEILPIEKVSNLSFQIPSFYSEDVREIASVMAHTCLFIGADSGIMHLASSVQIPTVGLFSVTNEHKYAPYGDRRIGINTNNTSLEESIQIIDGLLNPDME